MNSSSLSRPARLALACLVAGPLLLLVDTLWAWAAGWRVSNAMPWVVMGLASLCLVGLLGLVVRPAGRRWLDRNAGRSVLLVVTCGLSLVGAEWTLNLAFGPRIWFHHYSPNTAHQLEPRADILRGITGSSRVTFNSLGMRGAELPTDPAARRILCVGGSTTVCFYLDDTETWPELLGRELESRGAGRTWVGNLGQNAYATRHHLRFTRYSHLVAGIDDVVFLVGFNDFMRALLSGTTAGAGGVVPWWWRSALYSTFEELRKSWRQEQSIFLEDTGGGRYSARRVLRQKASKLDDLPDLSRPLAEYRANITALIEQVRAAGARPVFATHPVLWREQISEEEEQRLWFGLTLAGQALTVPQLERGMRAFNQALLEECALRAAPCINLSLLNGDAASFYDDCHFTELGARRVAKALADWFVEFPR